MEDNKAPKYSLKNELHLDCLLGVTRIEPFSSANLVENHSDDIIFEKDDIIFESQYYGDVPKEEMCIDEVEKEYKYQHKENYSDNDAGDDDSVLTLRNYQEDCLDLYESIREDQQNERDQEQHYDRFFLQFRTSMKNMFNERLEKMSTFRWRLEDELLCDDVKKERQRIEKESIERILETDGLWEELRHNIKTRNRVTNACARDTVRSFIARHNKRYRDLCTDDVAFQRTNDHLTRKRDNQNIFESFRRRSSYDGNHMSDNAIKEESGSRRSKLSKTSNHTPYATCTVDYSDPSSGIDGRTSYEFESDRNSGIESKHRSQNGMVEKSKPMSILPFNFMEGLAEEKLDDTPFLSRFVKCPDNGSSNQQFNTQPYPRFPKTA